MPKKADSTLLGKIIAPGLIAKRNTAGGAPLSGPNVTDPGNIFHKSTAQRNAEAAAILAKAEANAEAIRKIAAAIESQGGLQAVNLKVAEQYVAAFAEIAKAGNTIVVPQNLSDIAGLVTAATSVLKVAQR